MFGATRGPGLDVTSEYDVTVWCGDFNYRVNSNRRAADVLIENKMWEVMRANDQLNAERSKGRCFKGFCEGDITFAPTFKFDNGTDTYDSSAKSRVPSWTDRVLWKCNPFTHSDSVNLKYYSNVPELKDSDHRPVVARLEVSLRAESSKSDGESSEIKSSACAIQ
uniref:Inositol polyphosphate-related phosphatase domain-containing protein n=2 Tax=Tetraselmis chuii TaxID=63592 RepID=A0A7S1SVF3_9CHLO